MTSSRRKPRASRGYRLLFHPEALSEWKRLDGSISKPLKQLLAKRLRNPHVPGSKLVRDLAGCYKIKLRKPGYRLVYIVHDNDRTLVVMAVGKREDDVAYRAAAKRAR